MREILPNRKTARELLVDVGGPEHAEHSVSTKESYGRRMKTVSFRCTCGALCVAAATSANVEALRNVPEWRVS